ncbi:MAG: universal stress protein [Ignavibacteriales bacterium]
MYERLLVPYDGSRPSNNAVKHAFSIASMNVLHKTTKEVNLLYVVREIHVPPTYDYGMRRYSYSSQELTKTTPEYIKEVYQDLKSEAIEMLKTKGQEYLKKSEGISVKTHVLIGDPADKIIEFAKDEKIDLIIMGNVGLRGISRIKALGSVSRRVSEMASCPVLLVH